MLQEAVMDLVLDPLYKKVAEQRRWLAREAKKHRRLTRWLWLVSSLVSVLVALGTNFDVQVGWLLPLSCRPGWRSCYQS